MGTTPQAKPVSVADGAFTGVGGDGDVVAGGIGRRAEVRWLAVR
jgi:hypothetical protein